MILFRITMNALPEKQLEIMQTLLPMIEPTAKKAGCLSFGVFCDIEDKNRFSLLGEWQTREELDQHIASHQFSVLLGTKALLCEPMDIQIFTVFQSERMDAVHSIRIHTKSNSSSTDEQKSLIK
jgi:quinol monooxygenase YgiN